MKQKLHAFAFWQLVRLEIGIVLFSINWTKSFQMLLQILKKHYLLAFVRSFKGICKIKSYIWNYISGTNFMLSYLSIIDVKLLFYWRITYYQILKLRFKYRLKLACLESKVISTSTTSVKCKFLKSQSKKLVTTILEVAADDTLRHSRYNEMLLRIYEG